jgi:hypothetical protein
MGCTQGVLSLEEAEPDSCYTAGRLGLREAGLGQTGKQRLGEVRKHGVWRDLAAGYIQEWDPRPDPCGPR